MHQPPAEVMDEKDCLKSVRANFSHPDIARFENVRFRCAQGTWAWSEAVARLGGVPGKARLMDGGGRTAKRTRRREPGNTVAVWSRSSQRECTTRVRCGELSGA